MQLEFPFMSEAPYPQGFNSLAEFADYVKSQARSLMFSEHTEWLQQWKTACTYEANPNILILQRYDGQEWSPMQVAIYAKAFFTNGEIHRILPLTAGGIKTDKRDVLLTNNFERVASNHILVEETDGN